MKKSYEKPTVFVDILDSSILQFWAQNQSNITFRTPEIIDYFNVTGDVKFAQTLVNLIRRPPPEIKNYICELRESFEKKECARIIREIDGFKLSSVRASLGENIPILVKNALKDENICLLDRQELLSKYGNKVVKHNIVTQQNYSLSFFLEKSPSKYSQGSPVPKTLKHLFTFPFKIDNRSDSMIQLWSGYRSDGKALTPLHMDVHHSFLAHIYGKKKVVLYSPDQHHFLYPQKGMLFSQACFADIDKSNLDLHPLLARATPIEVCLEPSDLLVIPSAWFHAVYCDTPVFSYSTFVDYRDIQNLRSADVRTSL